jgi:hypothetical protein
MAPPQVAVGPSFPGQRRWVPHPFRSFIAERVGNHRPHPVPSISPTTLDPAPFFWRGPAEGGWPPRRWQLVRLFLAKEDGCPILSAVSSRKGWEATALTQSPQISHHPRSRAFFLARPGRRRMAPPQVVVADNYPSHAHNEDIQFSPGSGRDTESPQESTYPPGGRSLFVRFFGRSVGISTLLSVAYKSERVQILDKTPLVPSSKCNGINARA